MATSVQARPLYPRAPAVVGGRTATSEGGLFVEEAPVWLWGQGTPAAIAPFTTVQKGSIYSEVNASDDDPALWLKVDEGGDAADWVSVGNAGVIFVLSTLYDISVADSEQVVFNAVTACQILEAGLMWEEATGASGAAEGDITIGTASGGDQIVAADAYDVSQATGAYQALSLASGALAAGTSVFASHDVAASAAGTYRLLMKIRVEA